MDIYSTPRKWNSTHLRIYFITVAILLLSLVIVSDLLPVFNELNLRKVKTEKPTRCASPPSDSDNLVRVLRTLKAVGFSPDTIFDVGANVGDWSSQVRAIFSSPKFYLFEANEEHKHRLQSTSFDFVLVLLGNHSGPVNWYSNPNAHTGNSVFRENTVHFAETNTFVRAETRVQTTLDTLVSDGRIPSTANLLKIDAQGSELTILQGAENLLNTTTVVILELSTLRYNLGAPMAGEITRWLDERDFYLFDMFDLNRRAEGVLMQLDAVFVRKDAALLRRAYEVAGLTVPYR